MSVYLKINVCIALTVRFILVVISLPIVGLGALAAFIYKRFMDGVLVEEQMHEIYSIHIKDK